MAIQDGSEFTVEIRDAEGPVVVILSGELDLAARTFSNHGPIFSGLFSDDVRWCWFPAIDFPGRVVFELWTSLLRFGDRVLSEQNPDNHNSKRSHEGLTPYRHLSVLPIV